MTCACRIMTQTHILKTEKRTWRIRTTELSDRVAVTIRCTAYGSLGDEREFARWCQPFISKYDTDPRPLVMDNPHSNERAFVYGGFAVVLKP